MQQLPLALAALATQQQLHCSPAWTQTVTASPVGATCSEPSGVTGSWQVCVSQVHKWCVSLMVPRWPPNTLG
jgi:hypothetical protein